jgi:peptidoglycan/xylan/chitin deacetylase (PgdA/CDA1 family)
MSARTRSLELLRFAVAAVLAAASRLRAGDRGLVVLYHRVTDGAAGDAMLTPTVQAADFGRQLALLRRCYRVVPLDHVLSAARDRRRGGRIPVALTFDDDLLEHVRVAAPRLRALGLPGTFFLCGASLDGPKVFWWEHLEQAIARGVDVRALLAPELPGAGRGAIGTLAESIKLSGPEGRHRAEAVLEQASPADPREVLGAPEIGELARDFDVGFHTREHDYLPALDDAGLARALREGRDELEAVVGRPLRAIAYPHGGVDERVAGNARAAAFALGVTTAPTSIGDDPMQLGRVEPAPARLGLYWLRLERALRK